MNRFGHVVGFAFVILSLSAVAALAQDTTGTILGTITDASGAVLPGVTVTVKNTDTSQSRTIVSDTAGSYRVPLLQSGHYEVTVQLQGFQTMVRSGITVTVGHTEYKEWLNSDAARAHGVMTGE